MRARAEQASAATSAAVQTLTARQAAAATVLAEAKNALNVAIRAVMVEDTDALVAEAAPLIDQLQAIQVRIKAVVHAGGIVFDGSMKNFPASSAVRLALDPRPPPAMVSWQLEPQHAAVRSWVLALATDADAVLQPPQTQSATADEAAA